MTTSKKFYIKERNNPQFKNPYYIAEGQLTKKEVKSKENPLYGNNNMLSFETEETYNAKISELKSLGFRVN